MYKVLKESGNNANIAVENTETKASVMIGKISIRILDLLAGAGYKTEDSTLNLTDKWDLSVPDEIAKSLLREALRMKKPVRKPKEDKVAEEEPKVNNNKQPVDVFNLIFGIEE